MFTGPVRAALGGTAVTILGLSAYNLSQRPTVQTVEGIDNTTLLAAAAVVALFIYMRGAGSVG